MESEKKDFNGLKKHSVHLLPLLKNQRRETLEYTLNLSDFQGAFPRTTNLYKADKAMLEAICNNLSEDFISGNVIHESSDLGLTHKAIIKHRNGSILIFDGLYLRITRVLNDCPFNLSDLLSLTGVPDSEFKLKSDFVNQCVKPLYPEVSEYGYFYSYYTIDEADFGRIGLTRVNNAQARIFINDPHMFRNS